MIHEYVRNAKSIENSFSHLQPNTIHSFNVQILLIFSRKCTENLTIRAKNSTHITMQAFMLSYSSFFFHNTKAIVILYVLSFSLILRFVQNSKNSNNFQNGCITGAIESVIAVLINFASTLDRPCDIVDPPKSSRNTAFLVISGPGREKNSASTRTNWNS